MQSRIKIHWNNRQRNRIRKHWRTRKQLALQQKSWGMPEAMRTLRKQPGMMGKALRKKLPEEVLRLRDCVLAFIHEL